MSTTDNTQFGKSEPSGGLKAEDNGVRLSSINFFGGQKNHGATETNMLMPFLSSELIGGSVPYVPGSEDEAVWNAASQACASEKIHYCYTIDDNRCWYLAMPSSALASHPDTWCPLAAALPGNSEFWDKETVYLYEQEGLASALRWDPETGRMQVYIGPARTILPRIQSMDANFVSINPEMADIVPWRQRSLKIEELSRQVGWGILLSGLLVSIIAVLYVLFINLSAITLKADLQKAKSDTRSATQNLMQTAAITLQNDSIRHMVRVQELLDVLGANNGTLIRYQVKDSGGTVEWEALVPQAFSQGGVPELRGAEALPGLESDGRVRIRGTR